SSQDLDDDIDAYCANCLWPRFATTRLWNLFHSPNSCPEFSEPFQSLPDFKTRQPLAPGPVTPLPRYPLYFGKLGPIICWGEFDEETQDRAARPRRAESQEFFWFGGFRRRPNGHTHPPGRDGGPAGSRARHGWRYGAS